MVAFNALSIPSLPNSVPYTL